MYNSFNEDESVPPSQKKRNNEMRMLNLCSSNLKVQLELETDQIDIDNSC